MAKFYRLQIRNRNNINNEYEIISHSLKSSKNKVNQSHYRPEVPRGFQEVMVPRLRDSGPGWW
jgi:hypothetical protein